MALSYERRHLSFAGFQARPGGGGIVGAVQAIYTNVAVQTVANTVAETSLFPAPGGESIGSSRVIPAGFSLAGDLYSISLQGGYSTNGAGQTAQIRIRLTATLVVDTGVFVIPNTGAGLFSIDFDMLITSPGNPGAVSIVNLTAGFATSSGLQTPSIAFGVGNAAPNFQINQTIEVTQTWGAASVNNVFNMTVAHIARYRPL